jgi:transketolase
MAFPMTLPATRRKQLIGELEREARGIRRDILCMIHRARSGHPGGSLSAADIVTALYFHFMRIDPARPDWPERDRFILSKGHACPLWYACLARKGFFSPDHLGSLREIDGILQGHPDMRKTPGVDMTTGSLGQGLSVGLGMSLGLRARGSDARVYVVVGDGELDEGQTWEAAMAAAKFRPGNLIVFVDYNDLQLDGRCRDVMPLEPLAAKWEAFNWGVQTINGNDMSEVVGAVDRALLASRGTPQVVIARTRKGKGVSFMEDRPEWHGRAPDDRELQAALQELGGSEAAPASSPKPCRWTATSRIVFSGAPEASTRDAYGETLLEIGRERDDVVVVESDISVSTRTEAFCRTFPKRFYQFGVAEANAMAAAAGMATVGKVPFVSTYSVFASMRALEQLRTSIAYPRLNVKVAVSHGGLTSGNDGVTHQGTEDLGIIRTIPGMTIVVPADYHATKALVRQAVDCPGPVYLRFTRDPVPFIYDEDESFVIGRGKVLRDGDDVLLVGIGDMVWVCLEAWERLRGEGIEASVVDMHTLKPLDAELLTSMARRTGRVVTVEDHQVSCGLGGAVAEALGDSCPVPLRRIGLRETFAESGRYELLLVKYGMDATCVARAARELVLGRQGGTA